LIRVRNKYDITNLSIFNFEWDVTADGNLLQSGNIPLPDVKPGNGLDIMIPMEKIIPEPATEYFLNLRMTRGEEWNLVPEDHVYAYSQLRLPVEKSKVPLAQDGLPMLQTNTSGKDLEVAGTDLKVVFDLEKGRMISLSFKGKELIKKAPEPDFWRPPTDNDYGYGMDSKLGIWKKAGEKSIITKADIRQPEIGKVLVVFRYDIMDPGGKKIAGYSSAYTILGSGDIIIRNSYEKVSADIPEIPRMGMQIQLPSAFSNLKWFGRGPHENYCDRKTSALVGLYESTVAAQYVPYIRPQENGYKTDTRWLTLTDDNGSGLLITGDPLICFEALNNIHDDFESPGKLAQYRKDAKSANTHTNDVIPRDLISLNIDLGQMGVGGDDSWGAPIHPEYRLLERGYEYTFRLRPINREDDILKLAKQEF